MGVLNPKTAKIPKGGSFGSLLVFFHKAKCQTLKHVSTVQARYRISGLEMSD